jgi:hypothetical protein
VDTKPRFQLRQAVKRRKSMNKKMCKRFDGSFDALRKLGLPYVRGPGSGSRRPQRLVSYGRRQKQRIVHVHERVKADVPGTLTVSA